MCFITIVDRTCTCPNYENSNAECNRKFETTTGKFEEPKEKFEEAIEFEEATGKDPKV